MTLRIFVQVWCEIDPALNVRIDRQTGQPLVDEGDRLLRVSPLGRLGMGAALHLGPAAVTAFALGSGHAEALRHALAQGACRAVELLPPGSDPQAISVAGLADWLRRHGADLVLADRLAGLLAGWLGWAHLAGLGQVQVRGATLRAIRYLERGDREVVTARLPAVVRLHEQSARPAYVSRARIQALAGHQIEQETLPADEQQSPQAGAGPLQLARARTRLGKSPAPATGSAADRLQALMGRGTTAPSTAKRMDRSAATPEAMAEEFVRYLLHHNLLPGPEKL